MSTYKEISPAELQALQTAPMQLVDVRNDDEVARGVIGGALHIQLNSLPMRWNELKEEIPIVFYCHSGVRSAHACAYMAEQGFAQLYNLQGGILAWGKAGLPFVPKN
ncbi:MAG TPA: rhodanese-like domain-containing protein [Methylophilaceae bacterium]|jgi:rhodanese-related sulfurtransferase